MSESYGPTSNSRPDFMVDHGVRVKAQIWRRRSHPGPNIASASDVHLYGFILSHKHYWQLSTRDQNGTEINNYRSPYGL